MGRTHLRVLLISVSAFVWVAVFAASFSRFKLTSLATFSIFLKTQPASVRIELNGSPLDETIYHQTPSKLILPAGQHVLRIQREGYVAHRVLIEGGQGDQLKMDDVILDRLPATPFGKLNVTHIPPSPPVYFEINTGLIAATTPFETNDLPAGRPYQMTLYPDGPGTETTLNCQFILPESDAPYLIRMKQTGRRIRITGCHRTP